MISPPKERPILFSAPMVRALLEGRKTVTRRIVTVPWKGSTRALPYRPYWCDDDGRLLFCDEYGDYHPAERCLARYGVPGDRLWVRETWAPQPGRDDAVDLPEHDGGKNHDAVCFRADERAKGEDPAWPEGIHFGVAKWRPSIFMPRWASRITLELTDVRIERLHAITEQDAKAEGARPFFESFPMYGREQAITSGELAADAEHRAGFAVLWDEINADRATWHANPWVWRVGFRRLS